MASKRPKADIELERVLDGISESLLSASDEEVLEETRMVGEDPLALANRQRKLLLSVIRKHKKKDLERARRDYEDQASQIESESPELPETAEGRFNLLIAALKFQPSLEGALTVQHREFTSLSDDEVTSYLRDFKQLGVLNALKKTESEE